MPYLHLYRLFISHAWSYDDNYLRMVKFLDEASNFTYSNYSVPKTDPFEKMNKAKLEDRIRGQINPTQCVVILGGMYVAHSDWIQFEIDHAKSVKKPILGVRPWGAERMPQALTVAADEIVNWNSNSIVEAIRRLVP